MNNTALKRLYWKYCKVLYRIRINIDYLKLRTLYALYGTHAGTIQLVGYQVHFGDLRQLVNLYKEIFLQGTYYCDLDEQPTILDAGANIGVATLFFKKRYPNSKIIAFEPNPDAFAYLKKNIESNFLKGVEIHNAAVGMHDGSIEFYLSTDMPTGDVGASTIKEHVEYLHKMKGALKEIQVPCKKLSSFIHTKVDLLKLDIEGAESSVISELCQNISKISNIIMEYHYTFGHSENSLSSILSMLEANAHLYRILPEESSKKLEEGITYIIRSKRHAPLCG